MPLFLIAPYAEFSAILTATFSSSTSDATYPAANARDLIPSKPGKLTATTGTYAYDFGSARRADVAAIIHHNLTAGLDVRVQASTVSNFSSLAIDANITIPAYGADSYPTNPWLDITAVPGYSASGFRYWRLNVVGTNGANVAIGDFLLATHKRTLARGPLWGSERGHERVVTEAVTYSGEVLRIDRGVTLRTIRVALLVTDTELDTVMGWWGSSRGSARPVLCVPNTEKNDCLLALFTPQQPYVRRLRNANELTLQLRELSRGAVL